MFVRHWCILLLLTALSFGAVSAQAGFAPGDKVIFMSRSSPVYPSPTSEQNDAGEISRGTVSQIMAVDETAQRVYLTDNAYGWVDMVIENEQSLALYDPALIEQMRREAEEATTLDWTDVEAYVVQAMIAVHDGQLELAENLLITSLGAEPTNGYLSYQLAGIQLKRHHWLDAIANLHTATSDGYNIANLHNRVAIALEGEAFFDVAIEELHTAISIAPSWGLLYNNLANQHSSQNEESRALELYARALEYDPLFVDAYINRSLSYQTLGNYTAAQNDLDRAVDMAPFYADAYVYRAAFSSEVFHDYTSAFGDLAVAAELDPGNDSTYSRRGLLYWYLGDSQRALEDLEQAVSLNPLNGQAFFNLASVYAHMGDLEAALSAYKSVSITQDAMLTDGSLVYRGQVYTALGNYQAALEDLTAYINGNYTVYFENTALIGRAAVYAYQEKYGLARDDLLAALVREPNFTLYFNQIGSGHRVNDTRIELVYELQVVFTSAPDYNEKLHQLGLVAMELGLWQIAFQSFSQYGERANIIDSDFTDFVGVLELLAAG